MESNSSVFFLMVLFLNINRFLFIIFGFIDL
jgi:hypothetical protein